MNGNDTNKDLTKEQYENLDVAAADWAPDGEVGDSSAPAPALPEESASKVEVENGVETAAPTEVAEAVAAMSAPEDEAQNDTIAEPAEEAPPAQQVSFIPDPFMITPSYTLDGEEPEETSPEEILDDEWNEESTDASMDSRDPHTPEETMQTAASSEEPQQAEAAPQPEADASPAADEPAENEEDTEAALAATDSEGDPEDDLSETDAAFDQDPAEVEAELTRMEQAVQKEQDRHDAELQAATEDEEFDAEAELAAQIAEDEALERELQAEADQAVEEDPELQAALPSMPEEDEEGNWELAEMESCIEALLFMSDKPMSMAKLREHLGPDFPKETFEQALSGLEKRYARACHGIELVKVAGGYQFRTKPIRAPLARKLAKIQAQKLSRGAMETLAIIAYRQPVMKEDVDQVRGVDSSHFIRGLLDKKLVRIAGRSDLPGRPMLYETSQDFLEIFGLNSLQDMPPLRELESMVPGSETDNPDDEDPKVREMRRLVQEMKSSKERLEYDPKEDEKFLKDMRDRVKSIPASTPYIETKERLEKAQAAGELPEGELQDALEIAYLAAEARRAEESVADEAAAAMVTDSLAASDESSDADADADTEPSAADEAAAAMVADSLAETEPEAEPDTSKLD